MLRTWVLRVKMHQEGSICTLSESQKWSGDVKVGMWTSPRRLGSNRPCKVVLGCCHPPGWLDRCGHDLHVNRITSSVWLPHTFPALVTDVSWTTGCSSPVTTNCVLIVNTGLCTLHPSLAISLLQCQGSLPPTTWTIHPFGHVLDIVVIRDIVPVEYKITESHSQSKNSYFHWLCHMNWGYCSHSLRRQNSFPFLLNLHWPVDCLVQKKVVEVIPWEFQSEGHRGPAGPLLCC